MKQIKKQKEIFQKLQIESHPGAGGLEGREISSKIKEAKQYKAALLQECSKIKKRNKDSSPDSSVRNGQNRSIDSRTTDQTKIQIGNLI